MTSADWKRVRELFDAAVDLDPAARSIYLGEQCGADAALRWEVDELLAADEAPTDVEPVRLRPVDLESAAAGQCIGSYRIEGVLGSGGMGTVFLAVQESPQRRVALKTMRLGMVSEEAARRFRYESEVLGRLRHPGIAQVYEAGTWKEPLTGQDLPFFALEYIEGAMPFDRYVREQRLDLDEALALFLELCDAVGYGHQMGVIHRDLKPANVLVDARGRVRVIDFGIARAAEAERAGDAAGKESGALRTRTGHVLGTLQYMSPEQLDGQSDEIDTRSDVYALGVLLYELLAGHPPFDPDRKTLTGFARYVRDAEPPAPSVSPDGFKLDGMGRDLDWIARTALATDKAERYPAVSALAADVRRFLDDEPVSVGPPSRVYHVRKFVRRHRAMVVAAAALVVVLVIGILTTTFWMLRADEQRERAEQQRGRAEQQHLLAEKAAATARRQAQKAGSINDFFLEILALGDPGEGRHQSRPDWTVREALDASITWFQKLEHEPDVEADVRLVVGDAYNTYGEFAAAEKHIRRALELRQMTLAPDDPELAVAMRSLAVTLSRRGDPEAAIGWFEKALAILRAAHGEEHPLVALTHVGIGTSLVKLGRLDAARESLERGLSLYERLPGDQLRFIAMCLPHLGTIAFHQGDFDRAVELYRRGIDLFERAGKSWHPFAGSSHEVLAQILEKRGQHAAATPHFEKALLIHRAAFGEQARQAGTAHYRLALNLTRLGQGAAAEAQLRAADRILGDGGDLTAVRIQRQLAANLRSRDRAAEAVAIAGRGWELAMALRSKGAEAAREQMRAEYGRCLREAGELEAAEKVCREVLALANEQKGRGQSAATTVRRLLAGTDLGIVLVRRGRLAEAEVIFAAIGPELLRLPPAARAVEGVVRRGRGELFTAARRFDPAEEELLAAEQIFTELEGGRSENVKAVVRGLLTLYEAWEKAERVASCRARLAAW